MSGYHLAQANIGRIVAPLDTPQLAGFVEALEPVNALADAAEGFVWRLQTEDGDATAIRPFDDDLLLVNLSVWRSVESLAEFVYRSAHRDVMVQRRQWFEPMRQAFLVLWWLPAGTVPTVADVAERIDRLRRLGPTPEAFTFRQAFPPPGTAQPAAAAEDDWRCGVR
jgi:hypothetical protein